MLLAHAQRMSNLLALDKEFAPCRVETRACAMRGERAGGGGDASGMNGEGPTQGCGARALAERTVNMLPMFVTLDVSKLSGWLKACACCRVERRGGEGCGPGGGRAWGSDGASGMHGEGQGTRGAHEEHVLHGRDLGRVEAQRLVERRRELPSKGEHAKVRPGRREGVGRRQRERRARGGADSRLGGGGQAGSAR